MAADSLQPATTAGILQEIPTEKWPILQEKLKNYWPEHLPGYYALYINLKCHGIREAFKFKVYSPYGDLDAGFVAISYKGIQDCIIFPFSEDTSKLEEALVTTDLLDWSNKICIDLVSHRVLPCVERLRSQLNFSHFFVGDMILYCYFKHQEPFKDLRCPPNTYTKSVNIEDLPRVNEMWDYKSSSSLDYFVALTLNGLSLGLYCSETHKLLAWIFLNEYYFLAHLHCEEDHRRKGYACFLLKKLVNNNLEMGIDSYGYVVKGNDKSSALFEKLGFHVNEKDQTYYYVQK